MLVLLSIVKASSTTSLPEEKRTALGRRRKIPEVLGGELDGVEVILVSSSFFLRVPPGTSGISRCLLYHPLAFGGNAIGSEAVIMSDYIINTD